MATRAWLFELVTTPTRLIASAHLQGRSCGCHVVTLTLLWRQWKANAKMPLRFLLPNLTVTFQIPSSWMLFPLFSGSIGSRVIVTSCFPYTWIQFEVILQLLDSSTVGPLRSLRWFKSTRYLTHGPWDCKLHCLNSPWSQTRSQPWRSHGIRIQWLKCEKRLGRMFSCWADSWSSWSWQKLPSLPF
jgi:hypothetical protein